MSGNRLPKAPGQGVRHSHLLWMEELKSLAWGALGFRDPEGQQKSHGGLSGQAEGRTLGSCLRPPWSVSRAGPGAVSTRCAQNGDITECPAWKRHLGRPFR